MEFWAAVQVTFRWLKALSWGRRGVESESGRSQMDSRDRVMRGLDPRIHRNKSRLSKGMDGRVKPGHDSLP